MANKQISDLTAALSISDSDLFVLQQGSQAKKLTGELLKQFIDRHVMSVTVTTLEPGSPATASFDPETGELELGIPKGMQGDAGDPASETVAGVMKLYAAPGTHTDGTMSQKAIIEYIDDTIISAIDSSY